MKLGLITLYDNTNYGNKLQNFALQYVLENEFGHEVETFIYDRSNIDRELKDFKIQYNDSDEKIKSFIKFVLHKLFNKNFYNVINDEIEKKRINNIKKFDTLINKSKFRICEKNYNDMLNYYDLFIIGSDQIWNPNYTLKIDFALGNFIPSSRKLSYAASIGVNEIHSSNIKFYEEAFDKFNKNYISVRENRGAEIIEQLSGIKPFVHLDPTMLLDKEIWEEYIVEPENKPKEKFLLTYILGLNSEERSRKIEEIASDNNLKVINLMDRNSQSYTSGVGEFLWYIKNSEMFIADSFHAGIFSIIFEKDFFILNREGNNQNMNSRFETLLNIFGLEDRYVEFDDNIIQTSIEYNQVKVILKHEKERSLEYLYKSINEIIGRK